MSSTDGTTAAPTARRATLADVARFAGVSLATASKALNGRVDVRATTRQRVLVAAEHLGFEPNAIARSLSEGRSGTVGMLTSDLVGRFSLPILMGAEDAFGAGETSVFLCDARGDAIRERHHLRALLARRIDGLIVVGSSTDPRPPLEPEADVPVVYAYAPSSQAAHTSVVPDEVGAGRIAVEHMIHMGRRHIAHVSGERSFAAARDRAAGVLGALQDANMALATEQVHFGSWSEAWGRTAARVLLSSPGEVDAVICANDQIARGVVEGLARAGVGVPEDVAVMGFDNWDVLTEHSEPPLTSIDFDLEGIGRQAAELLHEAIDGRPRAGVVARAPRLVVRGSTGPSQGDPTLPSNDSRRGGEP